MPHLWIPILLLYFLAVDAADFVGDGSSPHTVKFFYGESDGGGALICNGKQMGFNTPTNCEYDGSGKLLISRVGWIDKTALLSENGTITGNCAGSLIANPIKDSYNLTPNCLPGAGNGGGGGPPNSRKDATGEILVDEWYSDLPWHQKLSTKESNLIDTPFVMPFEALPNNVCQSANSQIEKSRCMLRYGVVNVMAMHRTDTLYKPNEASTDKHCQDNNCVEVKIKVQRFHTLTDNNVGYQADEIRNNSWPNQDNRQVPSLGFAITEATIFAPWLPWYTGHYCAVFKDNIADSVCYEDYFTTQLQAPADTSINESWLKDAPALFVPSGTEKGYTRFCKSGIDSCLMYLGKVDWIKGATEPQISDCGSDPIDKCKKEVIEKTDSLAEQFNFSISLFLDDGRYPWNESTIDLTKDINSNPFIGFYELKRYSENGGGTPAASLFKGSHYVLPKKCTKMNFLGASRGKTEAIQHLEDCALNFEIHTSGFHELWKELWGGNLDNNAVEEISKALPGSAANQYGRTMFIYAGVPEQHIPVSFKLLDDGMSIHDKMYNGSIYTQYLPLVNPADLTLYSKSYTDTFWHALFMSNHMNQTPDHFIRGIRGRTLWHNEYRSNIMYESAEHGQSYIKNTKFEQILNHVDFPAGFQVKNSTTPFHGNTCDSCHIRNGSGVPLMPNGQLPQIHQDNGMIPNFKIQRDYTYSNNELPSMKMVLFDLNDTSDRLESCDDNNNTIPKPALLSSDDFYKNKIMNFYGASLHVNQKDKLPTYQMEYLAISDKDGYEIVDKTIRGKNSPYQPRRVRIDRIDTGAVCQEIAVKPQNVDSGIWPSNCGDVSGAAISKAIGERKIGFMHLLGRRLGNTPLIEMIPDETIIETQRLQTRTIGNTDFSGCFSLAPGTRDNSKLNYRSCLSGKLGSGKQDCYIGRFGWIGDRASLEDQIANAANVEMNITSKEGYNEVNAGQTDYKKLVRYNQTICGPADATCQKSQANSDITEQEINDMATYQRWIGIPDRSEYQVSSEKVQRGEEIFNDLQCNICHVIKKIAFDQNDNMLPNEDRDHLQRLQMHGNKPDYPFISYLGTDLLMHDMGYLSQVATAPENVKIRNDDGTVKEKYKIYVQHIRTPALKGLRFNQFVTDSNHNTTKPIPALPVGKKEKIDHFTSGCDFLLHDGRACDAIEATYLHDGPAIKRLDTIGALNDLSDEKLEQLRAFLYSL